MLLESWPKVMYELNFRLIDDLSTFVTILLRFPAQDPLFTLPRNHTRSRVNKSPLTDQSLLRKGRLFQWYLSQSFPWLPKLNIQRVPFRFVQSSHLSLLSPLSPGSSPILSQSNHSSQQCSRSSLFVLSNQSYELLPPCHLSQLGRSSPRTDHSPTQKTSIRRLVQLICQFCK